MKAAAAFGVLVGFVVFLGAMAWSPWESDSDGSGGGFGGDDGPNREETVPQFTPGATVIPNTQVTPVLPAPPVQPGGTTP
jgi:hypothetical protein